MDYLEFNKVVDATIEEIKQGEEYLSLMAIYEKINSKYHDLVIAFNKAKEDLVSALEYGKYHPDLNKIKKEYQVCKAELFSKEEVKEYFLHQHQLEDICNAILAGIKEKIL